MYKTVFEYWEIQVSELVENHPNKNKTIRSSSSSQYVFVDICYARKSVGIERTRKNSTSVICTGNSLTEQNWKLGQQPNQTNLHNARRYSVLRLTSFSLVFTLFLSPVLSHVCVPCVHSTFHSARYLFIAMEKIRKKKQQHADEYDG